MIVNQRLLSDAFNLLKEVELVIIFRSKRGLAGLP